MKYFTSKKTMMNKKEDSLTNALLLPTTTTTTTTTSSPSDGGGETALLKSPLYYVRHVISLHKNKPDTCNNTVPPVLPKVGGDNNLQVPNEEWSKFWTCKVHPIARKVERATQFIRVLAIVPILFYIIAAFHVINTLFDSEMMDIDDDPTADLYFIYALMVILMIEVILIVALAITVSRTRKSHLKALQDVCYQEEHQFFVKYGYTVECSLDALEDKWNTGFCIYFTPAPPRKHVKNVTSNGEVAVRNYGLYHQKIEMFNSGHYWTPISMVDLTAHAAAAAEMELPSSIVAAGTETSDDPTLQQVWTNFWSEFLTVSRNFLSMNRWYLLACYVYFAYCCSGGLTLLPVFLLVFLAVSYRYIQATKSQQKVIEKYAPEFAKYNVLVEYRRTLQFGGWRATYVDYLHVMPCIEGTQMTTSPSDVVAIQQIC